ncbi:cation transporter, partial [Candidatus Marinimicrobia bacterium]|nr:cation transporter [Candidatus Neomarinimicrobiota bacterium]
MKNTIELKISGMTCNGCVASVTKYLQNVMNVENVDVSLESNSVIITSSDTISLEILQKALPEKYTLSESSKTQPVGSHIETESDLKQLFPLFLIFFYIIASTILINWNNLNVSDFMYDFMGLFYIVFSFFKFLDYKNFPDSFAMYDPLAKVIPVYGWSYPFIETVLGLLFILRIELQIALYATVVILGITTIGVTKTLLNKNAIQCACLGTALKLPMTKATFIENSIMLFMATWML